MKTEMPITEGQAVEATVLLKTLAHPLRLMICHQLQYQEMSVGDMEIIFGVGQPRLSRELAKLRERKFVETRRDSRVIFYRLSQTIRIQEMIKAVYDVMAGQYDSTGAAPKIPQGEFCLGEYGVFARTITTSNTSLQGKA